MSSLIDLKIENGNIAIITLNRPESANALSHVLITELNQAIESIDENDKIRCTIITGAAKRSFSAGADLKERNRLTDKQTVSAVRLIAKTALKIEQMKMPTIAAINGVAFGGGLELALACDLRISADHAVMGLTETSLAIIPGAGGTQRLSRLIGLGQAKRLIYTAMRINAIEALDIGLVEEVVTSDSLFDHTLMIAKTIAVNSPLAVRLAKKTMNQGFQTDLTTALEIEHLNYLQTIATFDRKEGILAFLEKRTPHYKGH